MLAIAFSFSKFYNGYKVSGEGKWSSGLTGSQDEFCAFRILDFLPFEYCSFEPPSPQRSPSLFRNRQGRKLAFLVTSWFRIARDTLQGE